TDTPAAFSTSTVVPNVAPACDEEGGSDAGDGVKTSNPMGGLMIKVLEMAVSPAPEACSVYVPGLATEIVVKVATPLTAVTGPKVVLPGLRVSVTGKS